MVRSKVKELFLFQGLGRVKVEKVHAGDICAVVGLDVSRSGDTMLILRNPEALPDIHIR
jgi:GTP-binding protein